MSIPIKRPYDSTLARIAGNIAAGIAGRWDLTSVEIRDRVAVTSVDIARRILAEITVTETAHTPEGGA